MFRRKVLITSTLLVVSSAMAYDYYEKTDEKKGKRVVIVGAGTAGIGVAAQLRNKGMRNITIIDAADTHYYQPYWTLVGGGVKKNVDSKKDMSDCIPSGVKWVKQNVDAFVPEKNQLVLQNGEGVDYDYLVVAAGLQIDWDKIPGLREGLEKEDSGVVSIYHYNYSEKTFRTFQNLKNSAQRMLFTMSPTLIKCAGAPQKVMWLLEDTLRGEGLRNAISVEYWTPGGAMFGIKHYSDQLEALRKERGVVGQFRQQLVAVDGNTKTASFKHLDTGVVSQEKFDLLHVCPHMSAPDFIKSSPLASKDGWMEVDKFTLRSTKYANVFGLGDCTNTPNSKTAAAITSQAPVLVENLLSTVAWDSGVQSGTTAALANQSEGACLRGKYEGYASCPLIVSKKHVILAEFGYDGKLMETFDHDKGEFPMRLLGQNGELQQRFFYWLKEQFFPFAYWQLYLRGYWYGRTGCFCPDVCKK